MNTPNHRAGLLVLLLLQAICAGVNAHVEMKEPPPRHSQFSKFYLDNDDVDYNMKSPLGPIVGYPCRNFKAGPTQGTMVAGHPFHVAFDGIATHLGGDCQFAVSYDNGTTFAVVWDKLASCFLDTTDGGYDVPVPDTIPAAKKAIFAWTWISGGGAREYFMNCADVRIENYGHQEPLTAHELLVVNLPSKPTVMPKTGREEDYLIPLLKQRPFITVGKPQDLAREEQSGGSGSSSSGNDDDAPADGEPDPMANRVAEPENTDSTLADEITKYVYSTRTITDDDNNAGIEENIDAGYTYSELDNYRARTKSGNGLTVLNEDAEINEYLGAPRRSVPDAAPGLGATSANLDLWPASSGSVVALDIGAVGTHTPMPLDLGLPSLPAETAKNAVVTQLKTVTMNGTPFLQVVVQSNNTAVPSSLTIAY
ncbi:hypothetical protein GGH12_002830 [Coemansia sp. RSA 1822]|nr:hypothetical protein LPJ76_000872 [Coemansia sp. RSA 638]KAJ2123940.1 hypothetical protein IW147_002202 [Coemansia sp. RSA 720]KAJ2539434.1 hypothetical protein GGF49_005217 [Coemansia sp. RSA 1853]KAJ2563044.1 hypothetical protein GGH12_002830 [Coemansia sp. RSA 1822]